MECSMQWPTIRYVQSHRIVLLDKVRAIFRFYYVGSSSSNLSLSLYLMRLRPRGFQCGTHCSVLSARVATITVGVSCVFCSGHTHRLCTDRQHHANHGSTYCVVVFTFVYMVRIFMCVIASIAHFRTAAHVTMSTATWLRHLLCVSFST